MRKIHIDFGDIERPGIKVLMRMLINKKFSKNAIKFIEKGYMDCYDNGDEVTVEGLVYNPEKDEWDVGSECLDCQKNFIGRESDFINKHLACKECDEIYHLDNPPNYELPSYEVVYYNDREFDKYIAENPPINFNYLIVSSVKNTQAPQWKDYMYCVKITGKINKFIIRDIIKNVIRDGDEPEEFQQIVNSRNILDMYNITRCGNSNIYYSRPVDVYNIDGIKYRDRQIEPYGTGSNRYDDE